MTMRPSRQILRVLCALTFAGGATLLALGLRIALTAQLQASAEALASIGGFVVVLSLLGFIGAGREKSGILMLYFFINFGLVTCLFVSSYAAVAFQNSLESWLKLHWNHPALDYLRTKACCSQYTTAVNYLEQQFTLLGAIGFACLALVLASMYCVIRIVTVPIVMKNLLNVINVIFLLLGAGIFAYGCMVHTKDELTSGQGWIAIVFIVAGTTLFALSIVGVIGSRSKSRTVLLIYIIGIGACLVSLLVCAGAAFSFSNKLASDYSFSQHTNPLACEIDLPGCTNCSTLPHKIRPCLGVIKNQHDGFWYDCNATTVHCQQGWTVLNTPKDQGYVKNDIAECGKCPEWTKKDVHGYLEGGLQLLGLFAAVVCFFIIVGFVAAVILRKSLAGYQTDSI